MERKEAADQRDEQHAAADAGRHREYSEDEADEEQRGRPYPPTDCHVRDCYIGGADRRASNECERSKCRSDPSHRRAAAVNTVENCDVYSHRGLRGVWTRIVEPALVGRAGNAGVFAIVLLFHTGLTFVAISSSCSNNVGVAATPK